VNNLAIVVRIAGSFIPISTFFLFTNTKSIRKRCYGQGYGVKELKDSYEDTEEEEEAMEEGEE
jgi:hypothetical protein